VFAVLIEQEGAYAVDTHTHHRFRASLGRIRPTERKKVGVRSGVNKEITMKTRDLFWLVVVAMLLVTWLIYVAPYTLPPFLHGF